MKKILKKPKRIGIAALSLLLLAAAMLVSYNIIIPDSVSYYAGEAAPSFLGAELDTNDISVSTSSGNGTTAFSAPYKILGVIPVKDVSVSVWQRTKLAIGGMPFGVKFTTEGVLVVGFAEMNGHGKNPAYEAGLRVRDVITNINGKPVNSAHELSDAVEGSGGAQVEITYRRDGNESSVRMTPFYDSGECKYKTGVFVRDSGAGIGTVTYIVPETGEFAGLGHGICDTETGALIPIRRGIVSNVVINGIVKGAAGAPGEIKGYFKSDKTGSLFGNTDCGVYGIFSPIPTELTVLDIGLRGEVHDGDAYIMCTLDDGGKPEKYSVRISSINQDAEKGKCFTVKITDKELLSQTGGIIQGMSGSPIIQDGKLIGAVTHVMINDPTMGYGIFIENMLANS